MTTADTPAITTQQAYLSTWGPHYTRLPLAQVEPSLTNPRKYFDAAKLQELADSIKASDIHQPILVRPLPGSRVADTAWEPNSLRPRAIKPTHEIVAGERRYRAAKLAGLADVPVIVKHMTDDQVLEAQILENLQREDLTPLEEAEGYQTLMERTGINAEQVGHKVGKSRTYVYGRLKLLDLATEGRDALRNGDIDASVALLLARIPDTAVQAKALQSIVGVTGDPYGHRMSARSVADLLRSHYMLNLDSAPFDIKAQSLTAAGACTTCPKRTGANPDLFSDVKGADLCTDPTCHAAKVAAHQAATMAKAHQRGLTVIEGREAKAIMPNAWQSHLDGYLRLDDKADSPTDQPLRKLLAKAMAHSDVKEVLLANPHREGELVAVLPTQQVTELLALAAQLDAKAAPAAKAMADKTEAAKKAERAEMAGKRINEYESAWRWAVLEEVWAEAISVAESAPAGDNPGYSQADKLARHLVTRMANSLNTDRAKRLNKLLKLEKVAPCDTLLAHIAIHPHPTALLWLLVAEADVEHRNWLPEHQANTGLLLAAEAFQVNIDTVQKSVKDELRDKHFPEDQKALLPLSPAAQASGGRGEGMEGDGRAKGKGKKPNPAARARDVAPKTSAAEAQAHIAAAFAEVDAALAAVEESDQRAAPEGIEAAPHHPQAPAEPGPTTTPPAEATPAPAAVAFIAGDAVLLDGDVEGVVVKHHKVAGAYQYNVRLPALGMLTVSGDRLGRVAA
jgi:ParB/RepB/Spo0J family partition protein